MTRPRSAHHFALGAGLLALLTAAPPATAEPAAAAGPEVLAQYVLVADAPIQDRTVTLARVILAQPAARCPTIHFSDGRTPQTMSLRPNPNPAAFGVVVCEAVVAVDTGVTATVEGQTAPLPVPAGGLPTVSRVAVLGDSGCKAPKQDCDSGWALPAIAAHAAQARPDLVIHVGDYNYRGTPNKTGAGQWSYDGCVPADGGPLVGQSTYDTWSTWNADFFTAAKPLLEAAPWVVVRGNHELCSRAGRGWFYFLDPHSALLDPYQALPGCDAPTALTQPYRLRFPNLDLVVLDTANACGGEDPESSAGSAYEVASYQLQLSAADALLSDGPRPAWLLGHRPIWSLGQYDASSPPSSENQTLQPALAATPRGQLPPAVALVLSGHMHQFFSMTFRGPRPPQLVIGNSGVELSGNALPSPYQDQVDGLPASGLSIAAGDAYGYLDVRLEHGGAWSGTVQAFDAAGTPQAAPLASCALPLRDGHLCQTP